MRRLVPILALLLVAGDAPAQEESIRPGFNEFWEEPDMERAKELLEERNPIIFEYRHAIVAALGLKPGDAAADVGAGTGFIALLLAEKVGPDGTVYALAAGALARTVTRSPGSRGTTLSWPSRWVRLRTP